MKEYAIHLMSAALLMCMSSCNNFTESTGNLQLTSTNSILLNTTMISSTSVPVWRTQRPSLGGYGSGGGGGGGTSGLNIGQSSSPVDRSSPPGVTGLSLRITPFPLVTVHRGERLEFQCAVVRDDEGAGPRRGRSQQHTLEWQYRPNRSGQWQDLKKGKSKKKRGNKLSEIAKRGQYRCFLRQTLLRSEWIFSDVCEVSILEDAKIIEAPKNQIVVRGGSVELTCRAVGSPPPSIKWSLNGIPLVAHTNRTKINLVINELSTVTCSVANVLSDGSSSLSDRTASATISIRQACSGYDGVRCSHSIPPGTMVFYSQSEHVSWTLALNSVISDPICRHALAVRLCRQNYKDCEGSAVFDICSKDCKWTEDWYCHNETGLPSKLRRLSLHTCPTSDVSDRCTSLPLKPLVPTEHCYSKRGQAYIGRQGRTASGRACQSWSSDTPTSHVYAWLEGAVCRNPAPASRSSPWCYTIDTDAPWEYCNVSVCDDDDSYTETGQDFNTFLNNLFPSHALKYLIPLIALVVALVVGFVIYARRLHKSQVDRRNNIRYHNAPGHDALSIDMGRLPANSCYHQRCLQDYMDDSSTLTTLEYPRNDIIYTGELSKGAFGRIFKAMAGVRKTGKTYDIIVKVLNEDCSKDLRDEFNKIIGIMSTLSHPGIVKLHGVCTLGEPQCMLLEYMKDGALDEYLRSCKSEHLLAIRRSNKCKTTELEQQPHQGDDVVSPLPLISHIQLLSISRQIADAMVYISKKCLIHRDLAARNCLIANDNSVPHNLCAKISDFGMTRELPSMTLGSRKGHILERDDEPIAIRWMAPETLLHKVFTVESDIWSFGILVWEIFTFGLRPYASIASCYDVAKFVVGGGVLSSPCSLCQSNDAASELIAKEVFELLRLCWGKRSVNRPPFVMIERALCEQLNRILVDNKRSVDHF